MLLAADDKMRENECLIQGVHECESTLQPFPPMYESDHARVGPSEHSMLRGRDLHKPYFRGRKFQTNGAMRRYRENTHRPGKATSDSASQQNDTSKTTNYKLFFNHLFQYHSPHHQYENNNGSGTNNTMSSSTFRQQQHNHRTSQQLEFCGHEVKNALLKQLHKASKPKHTNTGNAITALSYIDYIMAKREDVAEGDAITDEERPGGIGINIALLGDAEDGQAAHWYRSGGGDGKQKNSILGRGDRTEYTIHFSLN